MESNQSARRTEDIALDLLKFVANDGQCGRQGIRIHDRLWHPNGGKGRRSGDAPAGAVCEVAGPRLNLP